MSENILCVTVHNSIFDAKCVIAQEQFSLAGAQHHWFIWRQGKSNNFKNCLPLKFFDARVVSLANFVDRFPTVLKGIYHRSRTQSTGPEYLKVEISLQDK